MCAAPQDESDGRRPAQLRQEAALIEIRNVVRTGVEQIESRDRGRDAVRETVADVRIHDARGTGAHAVVFDERRPPK